MATEVLPSTIQNFLSWQAKRYQQLETKEAPPVTGPFITISREYGCEGFIVAGPSDLAGWLCFFGRDRLGRERGLLRVGFPP